MGGGYGGPAGYGPAGGGGGGMGGNDRQLYVSNVGSIQLFLGSQRIVAANHSYSCLTRSDGKTSKISSGKQVRFQSTLSAGL